MKYALSTVALLTCLLLTTSCRSVTVVGEKQSYVLRPHFSMTYYEVYLQGSIEKVFDASRRGLQDLHIKTTTEAYDKISGQISGSLADGTPLQLKMMNIKNQTVLEFHLGGFANDQKSTIIFDAIQKHLD